jgi:hypothetical protein
MNKKYRVTLTAAERQELDGLLARGKADVRRLKHAQILLKADEAEAGPAWPDSRIAEALEVGITTVERIRQRFVEEGLASALSPYRGGKRISSRKPRRHNQDPDPVSSGYGPGAAPASRPLHQCGAAPVAAGAAERDPGRAAAWRSSAGLDRNTSGLAGMAGGADAALHFAGRAAGVAASAGVGQSDGPQDARDGAVAVRAWSHASLHTRGGQLVEHGRVHRALAQAPRAGRPAPAQP